MTSPSEQLTPEDWDLVNEHGWDPHLYAIWGGGEVPFEQIVFHIRDRIDPDTLPPLRRLWARATQPIRDTWALYMHPPERYPLNLERWTAKRIPHPREATQGPWIIRMYDRLRWYVCHPGDRYEIYRWTLKRRSHGFGLSWVIRYLYADLRGRPSEVPPAFRPPPPLSHEEMRFILSPAATHIRLSGKSYDPAQNCTWRKNPPLYGPREPTEQFQTPDIGTIPIGSQPAQLVFEHITHAIAADDVRGLPEGTPARDEMLLRFVTDRSYILGLIEGLLEIRKPVSGCESATAFFESWPQIPRRHAGFSWSCLSPANLPLKEWHACLWIDEVDGETRLFRQPIAQQGYPLGAAQSWPLSTENVTRTTQHWDPGIPLNVNADA